MKLSLLNCEYTQSEFLLRIVITGKNLIRNCLSFKKLIKKIKLINNERASPVSIQQRTS